MILLSILPSTLFRTIQILWIMISSCAHLALRQLAGITFAGLNTCLVTSFLVACFILGNNIFKSCPSFNFKAFERQQLYNICPYIGSLIIGPSVYNPVYSSSNSSYCKVHMNFYHRMYGSFRCQFWLIISISFSQCLTLVYEAWSWFEDRIVWLPYDIRRITTVNVAFGNSGWSLSTVLLLHSPKSIAGCLLPIIMFFLASQIAHAQWFDNISTHCRRIHSALLNYS